MKTDKFQITGSTPDLVAGMRLATLIGPYETVLRTGFLTANVGRFSFDFIPHMLKADSIVAFDKSGQFANETMIEIGDFCETEGKVTFIVGGEHANSIPINVSNNKLFAFGPNFHSPSAYLSKGPIRIGNNVTLSHDVTILSGVTIGDGAIIGAKSVVTKDVPPYAIVGGNPARVLKYRFPPEIIERLLALRWWDFGFKLLNQTLPLCSKMEAEEFLTFLEQKERFYFKRGEKKIIVNGKNGAIEFAGYLSGGKESKIPATSDFSKYMDQVTLPMIYVADNLI